MDLRFRTVAEDDGSVHFDLTDEYNDYSGDRSGFKAHPRCCDYFDLFLRGRQY